MQNLELVNLKCNLRTAHFSVLKRNEILNDFQQKLNSLRVNTLILMNQVVSFKDVEVVQMNRLLFYVGYAIFWCIDIATYQWPCEVITSLLLTRN